MQIYFVSDPHLGHKTILRHSEGRRGGTTVDEHDEWVIERCLSVNPTKRTLWYVMGDVAMEESKLAMFERLPGRRILVLGNHDLFDSSVYLKYFEKIIGGIKRYGFWITHIPVHPAELRGKPNLHGHSHDNAVAGDPRYLNAAIEWLPNKQPISLNQVRKHFNINK